VLSDAKISNEMAAPVHPALEKETLNQSEEKNKEETSS